MKKFWMYVVGLGMAFFMAGYLAAAPALRPADVKTMAKYGCTHVIEVTHDHLTTATTNTMQLFEFTVTAPYSLEFRGVQLNEAFDSRSDTNAWDIEVSVGAGTTTNKWVDALQVAVDGPPTVYSTFGTDYAGTATVTLTTTTNLVVIGDATSTVYFVTGVVGTSAVTVSSPWLSSQTANGTIKILVDPTDNVSQKLVDLDRGRLLTFWRVLGPRYDRE